MMKLCSIEGCGRPSVARGWCHKHYARFWVRREAARQTPHGEIAAFLERLGDNALGPCVVWPFSRRRDGYPVSGRAGNVLRILCAAKNGPAPTAKHVAAHSCGNGRQGCVNPHHLHWATIAENALEAVGHGTTLRGSKSPNAKLNEQDVQRIRRQLADGHRHADIASSYGVERSTITGISTGRSWAWLADE